MILKGSINNAQRKFEDNYINLRDRESRLLSLEEIRMLPDVSPQSALAKEWKMRKQSFARLYRYLEGKKVNSLLDLACGNGWLMYRTHHMFQSVVGMDINLTELNQAEKLLNEFENISLIYGDVFNLDESYSFDIIIVSAGIQYFKSLKTILDCLLSHLNANGEIHILDSPFYKNNKAKSAAHVRTSDYYNSQNAADLIDQYHHHLLSDLSNYKHKILYDGMSILNRLKRKVGLNQNPFPWIKITK